MVQLPPIERFVSSSGAKIYRIPCEAFPDFIVYAHLVLDAGPPTLVDAGSGYGQCTAQLLDGLQSLGESFGEAIGLADIPRVIITHGHIDHFGGLAGLLPQMNVTQIAIHALDRWVLTAYHERVVVATKALRNFLQQAGVEAERMPDLLEMYGFSKKHVRDVRVDLVLSDGQELDGMRFLHTPGHCPGQVCILLGDVLLSADHILPQITPHQAPESITAYTGLGHYLESLDKIHRLGGFDLALGGHGPPIPDVYKRIDEIRASHERKLERVRQSIAAGGGPTIDQITRALYPRVVGFNSLLALEEVGAHVEYLYQRGELRVANLEEVERLDNPPLRYRVT